MNQILKLRAERANTWEMAKAFLESHRDKDGMVSAEDSAVYDRMEEKVVALGKEIERLERQRNIDDELNQTIDTAPSIPQSRSIPVPAVPSRTPKPAGPVMPTPKPSGRPFGGKVISRK